MLCGIIADSLGILALQRDNKSPHVAGMIVYFLADLGERNLHTLVREESVRAVALTDIPSHSATENFNALARSDIVSVTATGLTRLGLVSGLIERRFYNNFCQSHLVISSGRNRWFPSNDGWHRHVDAPDPRRNIPNTRREAESAGRSELPF